MVSPTALLTSPLRVALRNPIATGPLLVSILYYSDKLEKILPPAVFAIVKSAGFVHALRVFLAISIIRKLSNRLSTYVLNHGKSAARIVKSQELALITGGASGIGELMAREFASKGVRVVILDLQPPKTPLPSTIAYYTCNVTKSSELASVASKIRATYGHPTILINNAGVTGDVLPILTADEKAIRNLFEVNTISHFLTVKEFLPAMVKQNHGHVVTIGSLSSYVTCAGMVDYACSKNSAVAFHEGLRQELRARYKAPNVRTTLITPSWIRTPMIAPLLAEPSFRDPVLEPEVVSNAIVDQVLSGNSGHIILPKSMNILSCIRGWPSWIQESIRNTTGQMLAMAETADRSKW
ncbi:putative estradiol 17-beta-dehydrogenase 11 [Coleophoma cylindrospora]|uniref:Short-chain dehydrogenase/reductase 3 n=1 Tax=Coleophoma cylindrospora TaxID=1849047 RepID=A0A3D8QX62_9HELO|nr:putative estradiol 17-beta-dehydrogenase 11 [Coleophoma cylindrospora]